jgi:hypothetical protein
MDGIINEAFPQDDGTHQVIFKDVDLALIDNLNPDELSEFLGIDSEFVVYQELI